MEMFFKNLTPEDGSKEKLALDFKNLVHGAEDLIQASAANLSGKSIEELRTALAQAEAACRKLAQDTSSVVRTTGSMIVRRPYTAIGIAACLGVVTGLVLFRSRPGPEKKDGNAQD